jgi:hypothetical protein
VRIDQRARADGDVAGDADDPVGLVERARPAAVDGGIVARARSAVVMMPPDPIVTVVVVWLPGCSV